MVSLQMKVAAWLKVRILRLSLLIPLLSFHHYREWIPSKSSLLALNANRLTTDKTLTPKWKLRLINLTTRSLKNSESQYLKLLVHRAKNLQKVKLKLKRKPKIPSRSKTRKLLTVSKRSTKSKTRKNTWSSISTSNVPVLERWHSSIRHPLSHYLMCAEANGKLYLLLI